MQKTEYKLKTKPYKHQERMLDNALSIKTYALFCEMGTGKTKVAIDTIATRIEAGEIDRVIVFAPRSVVPTWEDELKKHSDLPFTSLLGTSKQKRNALYYGLRNGKRVFITNYETILTIDFDSYFQMIVLDESTYIKNPWAKRTKRLIRLGDSTDFKMLLSGYPVTQSLMDIWSQYRFLDGGQSFGRSYLAFRNHYFYSDSNKWNWFPRPDATQKINAKIYRRAIRIIKADCLDLPPKVYERRYCDMAPEQKRIYKSIRDNLVAEIEHGKKLTVRQVLTKTLRLCQIAGGAVPMDDTGKKRFFDSKLKVVMEIIEENPEHKVVIWANFIAELEAIYEAIKEASAPGTYIALLHGGIKADRGEMVRNFQAASGAAYFIGQVKTGGYGITLTASDLVIYYSNSFSVEARVQSEDRTHRIGQTKSVTYVDLVTRGSVDEYVIKNIKKKKRLADITIGDIMENI